jgi:hypothetical protein
VASRNDGEYKSTDSFITPRLDDVVDNETEDIQAQASNRYPRILRGCLSVCAQSLNRKYDDLLEPGIKKVGLLLVFIELKRYLSRIECHLGQSSHIERQESVRLPFVIRDGSVIAEIALYDLL